MRIAFNTLHEDPRAPSNAVRFIANMVTALADAAPENEYVLYVGAEGAAMYDEVTAPAVSRCVLPHSNERRLRRMLDEQTLLPSRLKRDGIDALHCVGGVVPFRSSVPSLLSVITMHHKIVPKEIGFTRCAYRTVMFDLAVRKAHVVIVNSESNKADIMRYLPVDEAKIARIPDALDEVYLLPADPERSRRLLSELGITRPYLLFASAMYRYKGLETLLDAFAALRRSDGIPHELVVAGHGPAPYVEQLHRRAAALGVEDATVWVGHQGAIDLRSLYAEADIFVYPSLYETFGHPPLQAMGQGTPVVASDCSSIPEVVADAALLFAPGDVDALAGALRRVLGDGQLRARLVADGHHQSRVYTWPRTARAVLDAYARVA